MTVKINFSMRIRNDGVKQFTDSDKVRVYTLCEYHTPGTGQITRNTIFTTISTGRK